MTEHTAHLEHTGHPEHTAHPGLGHRVVETPIGRLLLVATPHGLARVAFVTDEDAVDATLAQLAGTLGTCDQASPVGLDEAASQLAEYFAGQRQQFDLPLDQRAATGFRGEVQRVLSSLDYGQTVSYAELATRAGRPSAVRAAASACATNPLPVVVPCHRVLRSDGSLGGYLGGLAAKQALLDLESRISGQIS